MTVVDLKKEIAALEPSAQDEIAAFVTRLRQDREAAYAAELERRFDDRRPESWIRLEDAEKELGGDAADGR